MRLWTWDNFQEILTSGNYKQTISHGDFHSGQLMVNNDDWHDLILLDWEWSGFSNPGIDLATWMLKYNMGYLPENENDWLATYWMQLGERGVDLDTYPFE